MTSLHQLELPSAPAPAPQDLAPLFTIRPDHPNVKWLLELLARNGWMTRKQVIQAAERPVSEHNQRWVRALVNAAGGKIVKGQHGFNHVDRATAEEIRAALNQRRNQVKEEQTYIIALEREYHQRIG